MRNLRKNVFDATKSMLVIASVLFFLACLFLGDATAKILTAQVIFSGLMAGLAKTYSEEKNKNYDKNKTMHGSNF